MKKKSHIVLIVDPEEKVGKTAGAELKKISVKYVYASSGEDALNWIQPKSMKFSLILSNQNLPDMEGAKFFVEAKKRAPDTLRYLIAKQGDIKAVTKAVNIGAIHRFIAKPWIQKEFLGIVKRGLEQFELTMENHKLFRQNDGQNDKLYKLNIELKNKSKKFKRSIAVEENKIMEMNKILEKGFEFRNHVREIEQMVREKNMLTPEKNDILCKAVISELFEQFSDIAVRHGFEMTDIQKAETDG
ncbi:MAG: response regulator [Gammaproteobacteria bacterium]|nr:response regulator [Gammaproteobacteria bacterium]